jgi:trehalose synthase
VLQLVNAGRKSLADYASLVSRGLMDEVRRLARPLEGRRVLHLSATPFGGGVAEILYTLVPLMADSGLDVEWRVMRGAEEFFRVTKTIHNALQGDPQGLGPEELAIFARYNAETAAELDADAYDFVVVHDPQPAATIDFYPDRRARWIWRGHIDFREYAPRDGGLARVAIWPPAIDPLQPKNMALAAEDARYIVDQFGVDVERPLLTQVSRFDPWKDPLGVIDAYRIV